MNTEARAQVVEQLKPVLSRVSNGRAQIDHLSEDARIIEDIGLASLDLLELRFELETAWNAQITDEEAISLKTIRDVVDLVVEKSRSNTA
ncbi:MAG TPA: phosphopantetheine-binding protein [Planctomycetaceae bacterium]|jgi:acyl carrier protein|nr:phosphopantetheine-binding protein [Planctomycetaceae bacterium]